MINSVQSAYSTQHIESVNRQHNRNTETVSSEKKGDSVTLSDPAKKLSEITSVFGVDVTPGKSITLADLEASLQTSEAQVRDRISTMLLENDVPLDPPVELTTDGKGSVKVVGDHPYKNKIEQLFEDNPDLANDFRGVSALTSFVEAGREYIDFAAEYDKDPYAAVAKYDHVFDSMKDDQFSMIIGVGSDTEV